jgi:hypothetical protein
MMGRREGGQGQFFYSFKLDEMVPADHLVRQIDGVLDLGWVHKELAPYYSHTGRPSIDPVLMIRMLIVGRCLQSARSGGCAPRCRSIWHIGGFASSASRMGYPTIVRHRIKAMGIQDKPISAGLRGRTALPRLIGSIIRECVDHLVVFGEQHLHSVLRSYAHYYRCLASKMSDFNIS